MIGVKAHNIRDTEDSIIERLSSTQKVEDRREVCRLRIEPQTNYAYDGRSPPVYAVLFSANKTVETHGSEVVKDFVKRAVFNYAWCFKQAQLY